MPIIVYLLTRIHVQNIPFFLFCFLKGMPGVFKVLTAADIPAGGKNDITALPPAPYVEEVNILKKFRNAPIIYSQSLLHG